MQTQLGEVAREGNKEAVKPGVLSDVRLEQIADNTSAIRKRCILLEEMLRRKIVELLGDFPVDPCTEENSGPADCWADEVIADQNATYGILNDAMNRLERL